MLKLTVRLAEWYDETKEEFITDSVKLELEHSLLAVSKWESEFEKPFLIPGQKTTEEILGYIRCMILTPDYPPETLEAIATDNSAMEKIHNYWNAKMTASWVREDPNAPPSREQITSELIYYWMTKYEIPWEAQHWHLSRLFMLIKIFGKKESKPQKQTQAQMAAERKAENARRRAAAGSKG